MRQKALGKKDRTFLRGADLVIGVDEVGRGALAGPVVVCAAAFDRIPSDDGVRDSKKLSPLQREKAADRLRSICAGWVVCEIWNELIDRVNILEATRLGMRAATQGLKTSESVVVVDHVELGELGCRVVSRKRADADFFSVAAASILAKVHRDRVMTDLGRSDPRWGWDRNKGYGTVTHRLALQLHGPGPLHRRSFQWSPVLP